MKVVIVDDHPLVRKGLGLILSLEEDFEFSGEAGDVKQALALIEKVCPDVVMVDLRLADASGMDLIKKIHEKKLECKTIVLTSSWDMEDFEKAEMEGVDGYILKEALPEELLHAIRLVSQGRKYYDPNLLDRKIEKNNLNNIINELTPREKDVLTALGKGLTNREIAKTLYITEHTVKKHVSQILAKLDLPDRTKAALFANSIGLTSSSGLK